MELKLLFSFLLLNGWLNVIHGVSSSSRAWRANVPQKISALEGSCVVIPCTYRYPDPFPKLLRRFKGSWITGKKVVSTDDYRWPVAREYKQRTEILGHVKSLNCTMRIDHVRPSDVGPFYFRIVMPDYKSFSYKNHMVSIEVMRSPKAPALRLSDELTLGAVSASCSVSHSCPSFRPLFTWSHAGTIKVQSKRLNTWEWETTSTLTFRPLPTHHNKSLDCTVIYRGGKRVTSSTTLKFKEATVKERDLVELQ